MWQIVFLYLLSPGLLFCDLSFLNFIMLLFWSALFLAIISQTTAERSWDDAYDIAQSLVTQMTMDDKIAITTGTDGPCVGNTDATSHFGALCLNDGPLGVRGSSKTSAFVAGINAAASFDREMIQQRGSDIAEEFRGKGINVWLGPSTDLLRAPRSGRGWEGFGEVCFPKTGYGFINM